MLENMVENIVGKGENAVYQHFLLFSQCFHEAFINRPLKVWIVWQGLKNAILFDNRLTYCYGYTMTNYAKQTCSKS